MAKQLVFVGLALWICSAVGRAQPLQEGDLIFHESQSAQSEAIRAVTSSRLTHVGVLFEQRGKLHVFEAVQPVRITPLATFIARGKGGSYLVLRLRWQLEPKQLKAMRELGRSWMGRDYDPYFAWDDNKLYCSEMVWKLFKRGAGIRLGEPQLFGELDLSASAARALMRQRGREPDPGDRIVTPVALARAKQLKKVKGTLARP